MYDRLAGLVYGKAIRNAQHVHLPALKSARKILIIGGGTGWILRDVLSLDPASTIVYVEASSKMLELSRSNVPKGDLHRVVFVEGTEQSLPDQPQFDAVMANFFLDLFSETELNAVVVKLKHTLMPDGKLLCTDFVDDHAWQRVLLFVMYGFFRLTAGLRNRKLPPWREVIGAHGFQRIQSRSFWNGFICSELYRVR